MDANNWNEQLSTQLPTFGGFLQTYEWGDFQASLGRRVERVDLQTGLAQVIYMPLTAGFAFAYVPKGPIGARSEELTEGLKQKVQNAVFLRVEPNVAIKAKQVKDVQPSVTRVISLLRSEEEIYAEMKPKTRYNIRLANKKGVETRFVDAEYFGDFVRLMEQTSTRDHFKAHAPSYYKKILETVQGEQISARLAMAFYEGRPIAANMVMDFAGTRTYLHGATGNVHRNVMAQYALHDFLIMDAKAQGLRTFDFWGVAPEGAPENHPWKGISRYKESYGGSLLAMPGAFELPVKKGLYSAFEAMRVLRKIGR